MASLDDDNWITQEQNFFEHGGHDEYRLEDSEVEATVRRTMTDGNEALFVETEVEIAKEYVSPSKDEVSTSPGVHSKDTSTLRRLWEQRIEEHEVWRQRELTRRPYVHKSWKPLEVLSACLLAVQDQSEASIHSCKEVVYWQSSSTGESTLRDPLFTYPIDYLRKAATEHKSDHARAHPFTDTAAAAAAATRPSRHASDEYWRKVGMDTKIDTDTFGGAVVHESIADAARTRHMWQQMAAQQQNGGGDHKNYSRAGTPGSDHKMGNGHQTVISGNGYLQEQQQAHWRNVPNGDRTENQYYRHGTVQRGGQWPPNQDSRHQVISPVLPQGGHVTPDSALENEKRIFMAYVLSHPEVITALGITVPWQVKQKYQQYMPAPNVRVELAVVGGGLDDYSFFNKHQTTGRSPSAGAHGSGIMEKENGHQYGGQPVNGAGRHAQYHPQQQQQHAVTGRYIKHGQANTSASNGHGQLGNGWQKRIVRRQSQTGTDGYSTTTPAPPPQKVLGTSTTPRQWKTAQWNEPQPAVNKIVSPRGDGEGFVDEAGNVYKSMGESIIAKEIREYREREEELRRSRSELGLPTLENMLDNWKGMPNGGVGNGRAQSVDHLQAALEAERAALSPGNRNRSGSIDRFSRMVQNGNGHRSASVDPISAQENRFTPIDNGRYHNPNHSPKNAYEKFLQSHNGTAGSGGHKVAAYPPQADPNAHFDDVPAVFSPISGRKKSSGGDFLPIEARIEQEVEELRRREEELRIQREAVGIRYTPIGIQASPLASSSPAHSGSSHMSSGTHSGGSHGSSREYVANSWDNSSKASLQQPSDVDSSKSSEIDAACMPKDETPSPVHDASEHVGSGDHTPREVDKIDQPPAVDRFEPDPTVEDDRQANSEAEPSSNPEPETLSLVNDHLVPMESVASPTTESDQPVQAQHHVHFDLKKQIFSSDDDQTEQFQWVDVGAATEKEAKQKWDVDDILVSI